MPRHRDDPRQLRLFDDGPTTKAASAGGEQRARSSSVGPAPCPAALLGVASRLPRGIRLGTSSWAFAGWSALVYDRVAPESVLAREGLAAYAKHPLLRAAGIDKTYYRPISAAAFQELAAQTPADFRFLVKAAAECTTPYVRSGRGVDRGTTGERENPRFLDADWASQHVVAPYAEGLAERAGVLVFQFSRLPLRALGGPHGILRRLERFLRSLPAGPTYALEIRNAELWGEAYFGLLARAGVGHCFNVHPQMPPIDEQAQSLPTEAQHGPCVVRWMLARTQTYEGARQAFEPFDRLVQEDPASRAAIARLARGALRRGREAIIITNNKAEGCAPLSVFKLAADITAESD